MEYVGLVNAAGLMTENGPMNYGSSSEDLRTQTMIYAAGQVTRAEWVSLEARRPQSTRACADDLNITNKREVLDSFPRATAHTVTVYKW